MEFLSDVSGFWSEEHRANGNDRCIPLFSPIVSRSIIKLFITSPPAAVPVVASNWLHRISGMLISSPSHPMTFRPALRVIPVFCVHYAPLQVVRHSLTIAYPAIGLPDSCALRPLMPPPETTFRLLNWRPFSGPCSVSMLCNFHAASFYFCWMTGRQLGLAYRVLHYQLRAASVALLPSLSRLQLVPLQQTLCWWLAH